MWHFLFCCDSSECSACSIFLSNVMVFMKHLLLSFKGAGVSFCVLLILKFPDMENILCTSDIFTKTHWWLSAIGWIFTFSICENWIESQFSIYIQMPHSPFPSGWTGIFCVLLSGTEALARIAASPTESISCSWGIQRLSGAYITFSLENCFNLITHSNSRR